LVHSFDLQGYSAEPGDDVRTLPALVGGSKRKLLTAIIVACRVNAVLVE
jgi:hypothetical protein